jgi:predicted methyltransferase
MGACASSPSPSPSPGPSRTPSPLPSPSPSPLPSPSPSPTPLLSAPDRSAEDRALDEGRHAPELFDLAGIRPGMRVADIGAWKGYTTELLARAVSPDGTVYAVDPPEFDKYTRDTWAERARKPVYARISRLARPYDDPFPAGTPPLDAVFSVLFYHDMVWLKVDRARMNAAIFRALKPGGVLVVADHSARAGEGTSVTQKLHRIEESVVKSELASAGFVLEKEADFLRHPEDPRDWSASDEAPADKRGKSDRFVLRFRRP